MMPRRGEPGRGRLCRFLAIVFGLTAPWWPAAAAAQGVLQFNGSAGQVAKDPPPAGQPGGAPVSIHGRFFYPGIIDLCAATLTVGEVLGDPDLGELVRGIDGRAVLPLEAADPQCSSTGNAIFRSPDRDRPSFRVELRERFGDTFDFHVKVTRATLATAPRACTEGAASAELTTAFVLDDGINPPVVIATVEDWKCKAPTLRASRSSRPPTPVPTATPGVTPTPRPPTPRLPTPIPTATPPQGRELDFTGKATRVDQVGTPVDAAEIRIAGTFCSVAIPDLLATSITFASILDDEGGAGELLGGGPLALAPVGTTVTGVAFRCQVSGPSCWMEVKQLEPCDLRHAATGVRYEYLLKIDRSQDPRRVPITYLAAPSCETGDNTEITIDFTISDATVSHRLRETHTWRCSGGGGVVSELRAD